MSESIQVGDRVRSFDFAHYPVNNRDLTGPKAYFVEGEVVAIVTEENGRHFDCPRYKIRPTRRVFEGKEVKPEGEYFFPPINGISVWGTKHLTNSVERI